MYKTRIKEKWWFSQCGRTWLVCRKQLNTSGVTLNEPKLITKHQWLVHSLYGQNYWHPFFRREKGTSKLCQQDGNIIHVLKNCICTSVATVLKCMKWLYTHMHKSLVFGDEFLSLFSNTSRMMKLHDFFLFLLVLCDHCIRIFLSY